MKETEVHKPRMGHPAGNEWDERGILPQSHRGHRELGRDNKERWNLLVSENILKVKILQGSG